MIESSRRVYSPDGISPTITTCGGGNTEPKIIQMPHGYNKGGEFEECPTITGSAFQNNNFVEAEMRVRKLTAKECFRLMAFQDKDFETAEKENSNTQLYKQAGNSIVVTCLMAIFGEMLDVDYKEKIDDVVEDLITEYVQ